MDSQTKSNQPFIYTFFLSAILILGFGFTGKAQANPIPTNDQGASKLIQLARNGHHGHHHRHYRRHRGGWYGGGWGITFGPGYYRRGGAYWTGWRGYYRHGRYCKKSCLISRRSGRVIRCKRLCY